MKTTNPGKQRKRMFNAPQHLKRKMTASHLDEDLILKYDKRAVPVIKGDTVKVMRGSFRGHEDKVVKVNVKKQIIEIEGITMIKADGNKIPKPIHHSNVLITKLNLTDKWRRRKLEMNLSDETKKEIEKEAEQQIKEAEKQKELEEEKRLKEEQEKQEETEEETEEIQETPKKDETEKKEKKTSETKPKTQPKKTAPKKTTPKKKPETVKKTDEKKPKTSDKTVKKPKEKKEEK